MKKLRSQVSRNTIIQRLHFEQPKTNDELAGKYVTARQWCWCLYDGHINLAISCCPLRMILKLGIRESSDRRFRRQIYRRYETRRGDKVDNELVRVAATASIKVSATIGQKRE